MKLAIGLVSFIHFSHLDPELTGMDLGCARAPETTFATRHFKRIPQMAARKARIRVPINPGMMIFIIIWIIPTTGGKFSEFFIFSNDLIDFFTISHRTSARYDIRHEHHDGGFSFSDVFLPYLVVSLAAIYSHTISTSYLSLTSP